MKILQISSVPVTYSGGTERVVLNLSKELSKKHEVTVLQTNLYEEGKPFKRVSKIGRVKVITCRNDFFAGGFGYSGEFKRVLKKIYRDFDVVHIHGHGRFTSTYALRLIGRRKPIIYTAHGFFHSSRGGKIKKAFDFLFRFLVNRARFLTALTPLEKRKYLELGAKKEKIKIIPNWIDLKRFEGGRKIKLPFSNRFPVLLYVGRIHESKGLGYVVRAIKDLDVNLFIVGRDGGYRDELEKTVRALGLDQKVKFGGEVSGEELVKIYRSSDFFVLFSEWEGFGIVVLEAMASGLPVIVSDRGALPMLIKERETGLIAKFRDVGDLKEKINLLLKDKNLVVKIQKNGKEFVKRFDSKKIIKQYEELYKEAVEK